jgi:succinate dehydrogenase cytochrome b subunit
MAEAEIHAKRPLSPHLQIYRPIPTMVMSILHRITGVGLYFATLLMVWWLAAAAAGPAYFANASAVLTSWFGLVVWFAASWALIHHMLGGLRHLIWDTGHWIDKETATRLAWANIVGSAGLTVVLWLVAAAAR